MEALNGTLRSAKRQKKVRSARPPRLAPLETFPSSPHSLTQLLHSPRRQITFEGELLMMPKDANVALVLLDEGEDQDAKAGATLP